MRLQKKSLSSVTLVALLKRRRSNLEKFLVDCGIVTYELLTSRCNSMGVLPPTLEEFNAARGNPQLHNVSSPTEGIVVLNPLSTPSETNDVVSEQTQNNSSMETVGHNSADSSASSGSFKKKKNKDRR